jgi:stage V sporulation protein S
MAAVNQGAKAIATARGIMATKGYDILVKIGFDEVEIEGETRTMLKFILVVQ